MKYSALIQKHFFDPYHVGEWPEGSDEIITVKSGTYSFGSVIQLQVLVVAGRIKEARFKAYGNPFFIASSSFITTWLEKKSWSEVATFQESLLIKALELPTKQHYCAIIIGSAVEMLKRGQHGSVNQLPHTELIETY